MTKVLITGVAGYLGQVLYPILAKKYKVVGIDNLMYGQDCNFPYHLADITSLTDMYSYTKGVDVVVALAGIVGDPACGLDEEATKVINYESTKMLADICETNKVKKLIFASSCSVYGASDKIITENSEVNPLSLYAQTKLDSEKILLDRCKTCQPIILRFGTLFGYSPRMRFDLVVNIMTAMAFKEDRIIVNGGEQWRALVHLLDVVKTIDYFIGYDQEFKSLPPMHNIYNVVGMNYQIKDIAKLLFSLIGANIFEKISEVDKRDYRVESKRYKPERKMSLMNGVMELLSHFSNNEFNDYKDEKYYNIKILTNLKV